MRPRPVGDYLARFGGAPRSEPAPAAELEAAGVRQGEPDEASTLAARLDEARESARAAALEEAGHGHETALRELEEAFARRLVEERGAWAREEGARLGEELLSAMARIERDVRDAVAAILAPVVDAAAARLAVEELAEATRAAFRQGRPLVEASGPSDLLDALRAALGDDGCGVAFVPQPGVEVRVVADPSVIESRLEVWRRGLEQAAE